MQAECPACSRPARWTGHMRVDDGYRMMEMACDRCHSTFWEAGGEEVVPRPTRAGTRFACPACREPVRPDLQKCPYCAEGLGGDRPPVEVTERAWRHERRLCPGCRRSVHYEAVRCPGCRTALPAHQGLLPLETPVAWTATGDPLRPFRARVGAAEWTLLAGDFPAEPRFTLLVDGYVLLDLDDWPPAWSRRQE